MMNPEKPGFEQGAPPAYSQAGAAPQAGGYPPQGGYAQPPPQGGYAQPPPQGGYAQPPPQTVVITQPVATATIVTGPAPPNYLVASIMVCLFCFWPTGICAIYYALQVNTYIGQGNYAEAQSYSSKARTFMITSIVIGAVWIVIVIIVQIVAASAVSATYKHY